METTLIRRTDAGLEFISNQIDQLLEEELPQPEVNTEQVEAAQELVASSPFPTAPIPSAVELQQAITQVRTDVLTGNSAPTMTMKSSGYTALAPVGDGSGRVFGIVDGEARVWQAGDKLPPDEAAKWKEQNNLSDVGDGEEVTDKALRAAINAIVGYPTQVASLHGIIGDLPGGEHVANDLQLMTGVALVLTSNAELMVEIEQMRMEGAGNLEAGLHLGIEGGTNAAIAVTLGLGLVGLVKIYKMIKAVPNAEEMVTNAAKSMTKEGIELLEQKLAKLEAAGDLTEASIRRSIDEVLTASRTVLIRELAENGIRHTADQIIHIGRRVDGVIVFLERGNVNAGLEHILRRHTDDFVRAGIPGSQIGEAVFSAAKNGNVVGTQGTRPIYEFVFGGRLR